MVAREQESCRRSLDRWGTGRGGSSFAVVYDQICRRVLRDTESDDQTCPTNQADARFSEVDRPPTDVLPQSVLCMIAATGNKGERAAETTRPT